MNAALVSSLPPVPKNNPDRKMCHRCENMVDVTPEEMRNGQRFTTCDHCLAVLNVSVNEIGNPPPKPPRKRRPNNTRW